MQEKKKEAQQSARRMGREQRLSAQALYLSVPTPELECALVIRTPASCGFLASWFPQFPPYPSVCFYPLSVLCVSVVKGDFRFQYTPTVVVFANSWNGRTPLTPSHGYFWCGFSRSPSSRSRNPGMNSSFVIVYSFTRPVCPYSTRRVWS